MTDKPLGRVIDIDAYFESLQQPRPQATEAVVSMPVTNMPQPEAAQTPHPESMPPAPYTDGQPPHVWPREGGLSIKEMLSFKPETIILLDYLRGAEVDGGVDRFIQRYEGNINFHGLESEVEAIPHIDVPRGKYQQAAERFLREGYLCSPSGYQHLDGYTVKEIQAFLRGQKMKVSGKRNELIARLRERFSATEIEQAFPAGWMILTPKGEELMEYHRHLLFFWKKYRWPCSLNGVHKYRTMNPYDSSYEVTLKALREILIPASNFDEFTYRSRLLSIGDCCDFFGRNPDGAIYWALVCYIDLHEAMIYGWGRKPSTSSLLNGIMVNLEQSLSGKPLSSLKDEFLKKGDEIRLKFPKKLCAPEVAWDILCKALKAK